MKEQLGDHYSLEDNSLGAEKSIIEQVEKYRPRIEFSANKELDKQWFSYFYENQIKYFPELKHLTGQEDESAKKQIISNFIDDYYEKNFDSLSQDVVTVSREWDDVSDSYYEKVDQLLNNHPWPKGNYHSSLTIMHIFPRFIKEKLFAFPPKSYKHFSANLVIAHEMLHFIVYDYLEKEYGLKPSEHHDQDNTFWQFTENLNALIEDEDIWQEFTEGVSAHVKPDCQELYDKMKEIWEKDKNIDHLVTKIFKVEKKNI